MKFAYSYYEAPSRIAHGTIVELDSGMPPVAQYVYHPALTIIPQHCEYAHGTCIEGCAADGMVYGLHVCIAVAYG